MATYDRFVDEFNAGVDAYWGGELPDGWNSPETRAQSPYLTGWYMASLWETQPGFLLDMDGYPLQEGDW